MSAALDPTSKREAVDELRWWQTHKFRYSVVAFLFVFPALANMLIFRYYPIIWTGYTSFWDYSLLRGYTRMVGFDNYIRAFTNDPQFYTSLRITLIYTLIRVPLQVFLGLLLAAFTAQNKRGMGLMRSLIFVPVVISFVVASIIWGLVLNTNNGLLNAILTTAGLPRGVYLTNPNNALNAIIAISIWKEIGYTVIILVAGIKGIPQVYYDAALVDGANRWQRLRYVTVPMLRGPLLFVTVTATLFSFQVFIPVYQLTSGGPSRSTLVAIFYVYQQAFRFGRFGYAAALSMILLVIALIVSVIQLWFFRARGGRTS
jgi:multiple sugar transport system permease protein